MEWLNQPHPMLHNFDQHSFNDFVLLAPAPAPLPVSEPTDEQLMERIQQRDESALTALQHRHQPLLRAVIGRMICNENDIDELLHECLLEIWLHADNYCEEKGLALGWIVTLCRRRAIDRIRRVTAYGRAQERYRVETFAGCEATHTGADEEAADGERVEIVSRLLARLPEAQQQAVQLTYYRGMSQRQIAAHTGVPLGTIKTRLELALRKLRSSALAFGELQAA